MAQFVMLMALLAAGCGGPAHPGEARTTMQEADLNTIGRELGLELPGSCRVLGYASEEGMDAAWRLKMDCDSNEAGALLAAPPFDDLDFRDSERYLLGPNEGWWNPEEPPSLPTAQAELPGARFLNVGSVKAEDGRTTLYFMWHTT